MGDARHELIDVKLARSPKAHVLLQLAAYSEQLEKIQAVRPEKMHVILGTGEKKSFKVVDFEACYRHAVRHRSIRSFVVRLHAQEELEKQGFELFASHTGRER